jgi:hypothetical protein
MFFGEWPELCVAVNANGATHETEREWMRTVARLNDVPLWFGFTTVERVLKVERSQGAGVGGCQGIEGKQAWFALVRRGL